MSTSASFGPCHLAICQDLQGPHSIICSNLSPRVPFRHGGPSEARGYSCGSLFPSPQSLAPFFQRLEAEG